MRTEDGNEQRETTALFASMLGECSKDGGRKLAQGDKVPWQVDYTHEAAIFSHLDKWKHGLLIDEDSGQHPLVHLAWRALAIAWQETHDHGPSHDPGEEYYTEYELAIRRHYEGDTGK